MCIKLINSTGTLFMTLYDILVRFIITLNVHISGRDSGVIMQNAFYHECTILITGTVVYQL